MLFVYTTNYGIHANVALTCSSTVPVGFQRCSNISSQVGSGKGKEWYSNRVQTLIVIWHNERGGRVQELRRGASESEAYWFWWVPACARLVLVQCGYPQNPIRRSSQRTAWDAIHPVQGNRKPWAEHLVATNFMLTRLEDWWCIHFFDAFYSCCYSFRYELRDSRFDPHGL